MLKYALLTIFIFLTPFLLIAQCGWYWQNPQPQGDGLEAVKVFEGGLVYTIDSEGDFLKTSNEGKSWSHTQVGSVSRLTDFHFSDKDNGWIVGTDGKLFHNGKNVTNWELQSTPTNNNLYGIYFVDSSIGWACGQLGTMLKTTNGGNTWQKQSLGTNKALNRLFFLNQQTGWAITSTGLVFKTQDGGNNWIKQADLQTFTGDVQFLNANKGWIVGTDVFYTNDGGSTWNSLNYTGTSSLSKAEFKNEDTGWAVRKGGIMHTTDGGQTWQNQINNVFGNSNQNFFALDFADVKKGWVVGINGVIRKTNNGGKQWSSIDSGTHERLYATKFINSDTGWVVGRDGNILQTNNGGDDWQNRFTKHDKTFHGVDYINSQQGWAVGENGLIEHTPDGGQTWQTQDHPTTSLLRAVEFADGQNGWAVGGNGTILNTTNGGQNWKQQNSPVTQILTNVDFVNLDTGWVSGWGGTILHTTNGGQSWNDQTPNINQDFYDVHFIGPDSGWAVGKRGTVLQTTDGGNTWNVVPNNLDGLLEAVHFINGQQGWAAGTSDHIYHTNNGGKQWQKEPIPTNNAFNGLNFANAQNGWAIGSDGTIIKSGGSPNANFTADQNGLTVDFINTSATDTATTWYFGDGDTSKQANPTHTFAQAGKQTVCLKIQTACGQDSICQSFDLCGKAKAGYKFIKDGLTVNFQDTSKGASQWRWQFGDSFYSSKQNPVYTFSKAGNYQVCQIIGNSCDSDTTCRTISVCQKPESAFTYTINGYKVEFRDLSDHGSQWEWFFDDGDTSMMQAPTHEYDSSGKFEVCQVTKNTCAKDTFCDTIQLVTSGISDETAKVKGIRFSPQPVRNEAMLRYVLPNYRDVSITIRNTQGKKVKKISWSGQKKGKHQHSLNLSSLSEGAYFYHFKAGDFEKRGKLLLIGH